MTGTYCANRWLYKPGYGDYGPAEHAQFVEAFDQADAELQSLHDSYTGLNSLVSDWVLVEDMLMLVSATPTFVDSDTFTMPGDQTHYFPAGAKIQAALGSNAIKWTTILSASYAAGITTVNVNDAVLSNPISYIWAVVSRDGLTSFGPGYVVAVDYGGGVPSQAAITSALAAIGALERVLVLTPGTWSITTALNFPANVTVVAMRGTTISSTATITFGKDFVAGPYPVFSLSGSGAVSFSAYQSQVYPVWWSDADLGVRVNNAIAATQAGGLIRLLAGEWCNASYATGIVVNKALEINFPGVRTTQAYYTGSDVGIKLTADGVKLSGGICLDLTGNLNGGAKGVVFYGASDCIITDGIYIPYAPSVCLGFDGAASGCYQNTVYGVVRLFGTGAGGSVLHFGTSGAGKPNANSLLGRLVMQGLNATGYGVHFESGYSNFISDLYGNGGSAGAWTIRCASDYNVIGTATIEGSPNGVKVDAGYLRIHMIHNNVSGTTESINRPTGLYTYNSRTTNVPEVVTPRALNLSNVQSSPLLTVGAPAMYSTDGTGDWPYNLIGNMIIAGRAAASQGIYFCTGTSLTPAFRIYAAGHVGKVNANQQAFLMSQATGLITNLTAGATHTVSSVIPDGAWVFGVTCRVLEAIAGTLTSFQIGVTGDEDRYGALVGITAGSTNTPAKAVTTALSLHIAAANLIFTATGGVFTGGAGNGQIRYTIHYIQLTAEAD